MALDVNVKINLKKPAGKTDFGYPLIISQGNSKDYKVCKNIDDVIAAGFDISTDIYNATALMFAQNNPPDKIAVCSTASIIEELPNIADYGWRQLIVFGADDISDITKYINATSNKMMFLNVANADELSSINKGDRIVGFVHKINYAVAALVGEASGQAAGSFTYKNLILKGIEPMDLTEFEIDKINNANAITFVTKAGQNVTTEGKALSGEYIDIIDSKDYIINQLEYRTQQTLNNASKIPYDNNGIAILESVAVDVMKDAYNKGIIAIGDDGLPAYTVDYDLRSETDAADRLIRKYVGGKFSFILAGAIHEVEIKGTIEI